MIRGLYISRYMVSGGITLTLFTMRAMTQFVWVKSPVYPYIAFFTIPIVAFVMLMVAAIIVTYPMLHGYRALIIAPIMTFFVGFFVYAYYIM